MNSDPAQEAIREALSENWKKAIEINRKILQENPEDIDSMNRLARAYAESGLILKAKSISKKVLKLDPGNLIARRCIKKWDNFKKSTEKNHSPRNLANIFIDQGTKTKLISLINLGEANVIASLDCGDEVQLIAAKHRVNILTKGSNKYIGRFPDNLAIKFINLIKLGATFQCIIKSANKDEVQVLVYISPKNDL